MKSLLSLILTGIILMCPVGSIAGQIYHWVDSNGHDQLTEEPPPPDGRLKEVIEFTPPPVKTRPQAVIQQPQQISDAQTAQIMNEVTVARKQATEARIRAQEAQAIADELIRRADEFKATRANTNRRRQKNKSIVVRLENDALQAQQLAAQAAEEARQAEERALRIEEKAAKTMIQKTPEDQPALSNTN